MSDVADIAAEREAEFFADAFARQQRSLAQGAGLSHCAECGQEIPAARRAAIGGVRLCVQCQAEQERRS